MNRKPSGLRSMLLLGALFAMGSPGLADAKKKGKLSVACKKERTRHCKKAKGAKAIDRCLKKLSGKKKRALSKRCKTALKAYRNAAKAPTRRANGRRSHFANIYLPGAVKKSRVEYQIKQGLAVTEGDIILGDPATLEDRHRKIRVPGRVAKAFKKKGARGGSVISRGDYLWPNATIPFLIGPSVLNHPQADAAVRKIRRAARHLTGNTVLTLREINNRRQADNFIEFVWSSDPRFCASSLGMQGGRQTIVCNFMRGHGSANELSFGTVVHEILHAAGFTHTQRRTDRDNHIKVNPRNSCPSTFKISWNRYKDYCRGSGVVNTRGDYDIRSIMHYSSDQCRVKDRNGNSIRGPRGYSFTDLEGNPVQANRAGLSPGDIKMVNEVYRNLPGTSTTAVTLSCAFKFLGTGDPRVMGPDGKYLRSGETPTLTPTERGCLRRCRKNRRNRRMPAEMRRCERRCTE